MMKRLLLVSLISAALAAPAAYARDDRLKFPIQDGLNSAPAQGKIDASVRLFWGDQQFPTPQQTFGTYTTNKKTNALNKSDHEACDINFISAIIALQERAHAEGGNAVVNIHSYYKSVDVSSQTDYECGAGTFLSGVALRGTVVKLP
jgi:uncharacterized protein YbjQ (UPF0145 family)